jgi:hypothetical protein
MRALTHHQREPMVVARDRGVVAGRGWAVAAAAVAVDDPRLGRRGGDHRHGGPDLDALSDGSASVAAEFRGRARSVRDRCISSAIVTGPLMRKIVADAQLAYKVHMVSARFLDSIERRWRAIETAGSLLQRIERAGRSLTITDLRVTGNLSRQARWDDGEQELSLMLVRNQVTMRKQSMVWSAPVAAVVSNHAIGRWHARRFNLAADGLFEDLRLLADAAPGLIVAARTSGDPEFSVETGGGDCQGLVSNDGSGHLFLNTRTFF